MIRTRCKTCAYWSPQVQSVYGQCRRFPPTPYRTTEEGELIQQDAWPLLTANEWCGEWRGKAKPEKPIELPPKGVRLL